MGRIPVHWKTPSPRPNGLMARPGTESSNPSPSSGESSNHRFLSDASEIPGFRAAVLKVRIHLPLARSPDQPPCIVEFRSKARRPRGTSALLAADCEDTIARHMVGQALLAAQFVPESTSHPKCRFADGQSRIAECLRSGGGSPKFHDPKSRRITSL